MELQNTKTHKTQAQSAFTLAEVLITKRASEVLCLHKHFQASEIKAPFRQIVKRCAFTLAEVLITIGIIGIVAAMTIPALMSDSNDKELSTAKEVANAKFIEAMNQMRIDEALTGYNSAEDFANALKKYMKVIKVCSSSDLAICFAHPTIQGEGNSVNVSKYATSANMMTDF